MIGCLGIGFTTDDTGVISKEKPAAADDSSEPVDAEGVMRGWVIVGRGDIGIREVLGNLRVGRHAHPSVRFRRCDRMEMMLIDTMLLLYISRRGCHVPGTVELSPEEHTD